MANIQMSTPSPPYALDPTFVPPNMSTPTPPQLVPTVNTGGPLPPQQVPTVNTGGNQPPIQIQGYNAPALDGSQFVANMQPGTEGNAQAPVDVVQGITNALLSREGQYITNARRRGLETANQRGLLNSSMAAGAAQRAAVEAAQPLIGQAMGLTENREQRNFQGQQQALDRTQSVNNALLGNQLQERQMGLQNYYSKDQAVLDAQLREQLQSRTVEQQDWLNDRTFSRQFNASLSMMPIQNIYDMNRAIMNYAAENPEVYTPDIISGMTNFFQMNLLGTLQQYFPNLVNTGGGS